MRVREAKDFLVQQTAEQAAIENVPLSTLEKRMMYFTEAGECPEDPVALNDAFEAEYDTEEYEAKTSRLLHNAYRRLLKEDKNQTRHWNDAIRTLRKGDHYLLVLWDQGPQERPPYDSLKLLGTAILVIVVGGALMISWMFLADRYHLHWKSGPEVHRASPVWLQPLFWFLVIAGYLYFFVLPWIFKKAPVGFGQLVSKLVGAFLKNKSQK